MFITEKNDQTEITVHIVDSDGIYGEKCCSLNGVPVGRLYYWCNCLGEINCPGEDAHEVWTEADLPLNVAELYNKYQCAGNGFHVYTVTFNNRHGMLASLLIDQTWAEDCGISMQSAFEGMKQVALQLQRQDKLLPHGCEIIVMQDTDPDGHEMAFFFPEESCAGFPDFASRAEMTTKTYRLIKRMAKSVDAHAKSEKLVKTN